MTNYELMIIVSGQLPEDLAKDITGKIKKIVIESGAKEVRDDFWGRRKLAYNITGLDYGYYNVLNFAAEPDKIAKIEPEIKLLNEIIRFMLVKNEKFGKASKKNLKSEKKLKLSVQDKELKEKVITTTDEVKKEDRKKAAVEEKPKESKKVKSEPEAVNKKTEDKTKVKVDKERLEELDKKIDEILND